MLSTQVPEIAQARVDTADLAQTLPTLGSYADPTTGTERHLAEVLADLVGVKRVSVDAHFFDDLGADSMVMARFCARVRKRTDLPSVSMTDIYRHVLAPDFFLMKGEEIPPHTRWLETQPERYHNDRPGARPNNNTHNTAMVNNTQYHGGK